MCTAPQRHVPAAPSPTFPLLSTSSKVACFIHGLYGRGSARSTVQVTLVQSSFSPYRHHSSPTPTPEPTPPTTTGRAAAALAAPGLSLRTSSTDHSAAAPA